MKFLALAPGRDGAASLKFPNALLRLARYRRLLPGRVRPAPAADVAEVRQPTAAPHTQKAPGKQKEKMAATEVRLEQQQEEGDQEAG